MPTDNDSTNESSVTRRDLLRKSAAGTGAAALGVTAFSGTSMAWGNRFECARTIGYWKNHPEEWKGEDHLHLFTIEYHDEDKYKYFERYDGRPSVMEILEMPTKGDKSIIMAKQLIATLLNDKAGTDVSCIEDTVKKARKWLKAHPVGCGQRRWDGGEWIKDRLDAYNNGELCACKAD